MSVHTCLHLYARLAFGYHSSAMDQPRRQNERARTLTTHSLAVTNMHTHFVGANFVFIVFLLLASH